MLGDQHTAEGVFSGVIDEVVEYVRDGVSVHLVGPPASGRSEVLGLVADRLDDAGSTLVRLHGVAAWRREPFGALLAAGIVAPTGPGQPPRRSAADMVAAVSQQLRGGSVVLVCDDADELDPQSVGALLNAHRQRRFVAVTTSRPPHPVQQDSLAVGLAPAVRVPVGMLEFDQVHRMCQVLLDGPVDAGALARIAMKSGGLHGLVNAIVHVGRRTGRLVRRGNVWTIPDDIWSPHLAATLDPFLVGVDQPLLEGATTLAVTGPVPLEKAEAMLDRVVLDGLCSLGLVHYSADGTDAVVGLYPPLLAEYLRREGLPLGLARARNLHLSGEPVSFARAYDAGLTRQLDPGSAIGSDAAVLNQRQVQRLGEDVARARRAWATDPTLETGHELAVALRAAAAPPEQIERVVRETPVDAESEAAAGFVVWQAMWRAVDLNDLAGGLRVIEDHEERLPRYATLLRATRANIHFLRDRVPDADPEGDPDGERHGVEMVTLVRAERMIAAGAVVDARDVLEPYRAQVPRFVTPAALHGIVAEILAGDLDAGIDSATDKLRAAHQRANPGLIQAYSYLAILGLGIAGRLGEAAQLLFRTLSSSTVASFREVFHTGVLVLGAEVAIAQGRPAYARTLAAQALATQPGTGPYPGMVPSIVVGLFPDAEESARGLLWQLVGERLERGYASSAVFLAVEANEQGVDVEAATRVRDVAEQMQGSLLPVLGRFVHAAATDDLDALAEAIEAFEKTGARLYAVRAAVARAIALRRAGRPEEGAEQADRAWQLSSVAGYERAGLFTHLVEHVGLSARELEIAQLIASPMTTAEVASNLQMSVRTVETHLHNVNRKLGTTGREHMVRAITTWLRPAHD